MATAPLVSVRSPARIRTREGKIGVAFDHVFPERAFDALPRSAEDLAAIAALRRASRLRRVRSAAIALGLVLAGTSLLSLARAREEPPRRAQSACSPQGGDALVSTPTRHFTLTARN